MALKGFGHQAVTILWAQARAYLNSYSRSSRFGLMMVGLVAVLWYGAWSVAAISAAHLAAAERNMAGLQRFLGPTLLLLMIYWQVIPLLMASTGASLDLKRLLIYPIPVRQLFALDVLLRAANALEMLIIAAGLAIGLLLNPLIPKWAPPALILFVAFNLFLATGMRDLLSRLLRIRRYREVVVLAVVLIAALPQVLLRMVDPEQWNRLPWLKDLADLSSSAWWPWVAIARLAIGHGTGSDLSVTAGTLLLTLTFGYGQFRRGLRYAAEPVPIAPGSKVGWFDEIYRLPSAILPDPLGVLVEKEIRTLSRTSRFRLVFLMGFSFGLLIWLPLAFGEERHGSSVLTRNYFTIVCVYAMLLLGEVPIWNTFGFDRSAVQTYFLAPLRPAAVLVAKNISALLMVALEIAMITVVCRVLHVPMSVPRIFEAYLITAFGALYLLAIGNLSSVYEPRPVDPSHAWRSASASRFRAMLLILLPLVSAPFLVAYFVRDALHSTAGFYLALAGAGGLGALLYAWSLSAASRAIEARREQIISVLSQGQGPVAA